VGEKAKTFMMEVFSMGKVSLKLFKLIEPLLMQMTLEQLQTFKSEMTQ